MEDEVRTRIIYDYGRYDFEQELEEYLGVTQVPTDEEWVQIQAGIQFAINESAWNIVRDAMIGYKNKRENATPVTGFSPAGQAFANHFKNNKEN
jgi:hypothetical protein